MYGLAEPGWPNRSDAPPAIANQGIHRRAQRVAPDDATSSPGDSMLDEGSGMKTVQAPTRVRIEAPDASAAFALERRLAPFHAFAVGRGPAWGVEIDDYDDQIDEISATVRHWLRETRHGSTLIAIGDTLKTIDVAGDGAPLGSGYDGQALEHDP
jgi:hypothetical protein